MKVFTLEEGTPYEGRSVIGVYSSQEMADRAHDLYRTRHPADPGDYCRILEIEVDAPAEDRPLTPMGTGG